MTITQFQQILAELQARYPACFPPAGVDLKPLRIGVHKDLRRDLPPALASQIGSFLSWYTKRFLYRKALAQGGPRFALDGTLAGFVTEQQVQQAKDALAGRLKRTPVQNTLPPDLPLTEDNTVPARLELTLKFSELPKPVQVQAGYKFALDCDGRRVTVTVKPKAWNKLVAATTSYPQ